MKKLFALLFAAALVCLVSCEKEKDKEKNPEDPVENPTEPENPADSVQLNLFSAIRLPVVESNSKASVRYDAMTIYNNAVELRMYSPFNPPDVPYGQLLTIGGGYWQFRDSVEKEMAIVGYLAISQNGGVLQPGVFKDFRNVVLHVALNEDGSVFDLTKYQHVRWEELQIGEGLIPEVDSLEVEFWNRYYAYPAKHLDTAAYIPNALMDSLQPLMENAFREKDYAKVMEIFNNGYKFTPVTGEEYRELARQGRN